MYWGLRVAYGQGLFLTGIKYIFLVFGYFALFVIGLLSAFMWGVMML